jgi:hypothetical protein
MIIKMHNSPKNKIFARILNLILEVSAKVGKKIRKIICANIGNVVFEGEELLPTKRFPPIKKDGICKK